jgi:hypothetical protein
VWIACGDEPVEPAPGTVVHRAWREDVTPRYVVMGSGSPPAAGGAAFAVVRDEGEVDGAGGTVVITRYAVDAGDDERFLAAWEAARAALTGQQGRLGTRLHRASGPARARFVERTRWSSPLMVARAQRRTDVPAVPFPAAAAAYEVLTG